MTTVTAVGNEKGGVGKTTVTTVLADELHRKGRSVLVLDLDGQVQSAGTVGGEGEYDIRDVLSGDKNAVPLTKAIVRSNWPGIDVVPGSEAISSLSKDPDGMAAFRLRQAIDTELDALAKYDDILIDLPPALGTQTVAGLLAADRVLAVTDPEPYGVEGLGKFLELLTRISQQARPTLKLHGVLINKARRSKEHDYRIKEIREWLGADAVIDPIIPQRVVMAAVASEQLPLAELNTPAAREMSLLFAQVAERMINMEAKV